MAARLAFGLYAPGRMAPPLRDRIAGDVLQALQSTAIREQFAKLGAESGTMTQAQFAAFVDAELSKWARVVSEAGVKIDQ